MNYIGSKFSLIDFLVDTIDKVTGYSDGKGKVFADLFAGTGVVGKTFKQKGYKIISNDIQYYSYILNNHYILNNEELGSAKLNYLNGIEEIDGYLFNNYCLGSGSERNYFSDYNGKKCDAMRIAIEELYANSQINKNEYMFYLASLINSIDKYANTASVYGAFLKKIKKSADKNLKLELLPIVKGNEAGEVYNEDANNLVNKIQGDILYLDPPYNERQYCANYHVLETIARYDYPEIKGKTGLRDYKFQKSKFCSTRTVLSSFDELIKNAKFKYIFLSYNNEGLMTIDEIKEIMSQYGVYQLYTTEYKRFKADKEENRNYKNNKTVEYLHCLIK